MKFEQATKRHGAVRRAAQEDPARARELWLAVLGTGGEPELDSYEEAAQDLAPPEHAATLAKGETATAYAFSRLWERRGEALTASPHERRELAREAWEAFTRRAEAAGDVEYGLGYSMDSCWADAWETAREIHPQYGDMSAIIRIARLAGRMMAQLRRDRANRVCVAPEEVYSVELGNTLSRLLPSELCHLGQPTEIVLLEALAGGKALQYAVRGAEDASRGPLIIAKDESGSMHSHRGEWSVAATIVLTRTAWEDKRTVSVVHWSTSVKVTELRPGDTEGLRTVLRTFLGGDNDCALALTNAADEVDRLQKQGDKGADVVLLTDGVEPFDERHDQAIDRIDARKARLWTVGIECPIEEDCCIRSRAAQYTEIGHSDLVSGSSESLAGSVV